ncbi:response regulator [Pelomonas sp. KK5]|uniref:response regulator n=1 Tax=Pelomonas sp. KK5 TaxID=1855730 RepID=UPI001E485105|nr:response regulator [Pelomonas sp. KK5]
MSPAAALPRVMLFEQHFVMRRTIVSVARDLGVAEVQDASTIDRARALLASGVYEGVVLELDDASHTVDMLAELRLGRFKSQPDAPVIVLTNGELRRGDEERLQSLAVSQVLTKPFKIGELLNAVARSRKR